MPRVARIVVPGAPHHVTQRGNNRQAVFFTDDDRRLYLNLLAEECTRHSVTVLAYCLMTNHTHLIAIPRQAASLAKALGRTHWRYTQIINRLHRRSGHLWQNRFHSAAMDDHHTGLAMRYIELNPVRAKICRLPWRYAWSSAAVHCGDGRAHAVLDMPDFLRRATPHEWRDVLQQRLDKKQVDQIRRATTTGRPLAGDSWLSKAETKLGKRLRPLARGRPRKQKNTVTRRASEKRKRTKKKR